MHTPGFPKGFHSPSHPQQPLGLLSPSLFSFIAFAVVVVVDQHSLPLFLLVSLAPDVVYEVPVGVALVGVLTPPPKWQQWLQTASPSTSASRIHPTSPLSPPSQTISSFPAFVNAILPKIFTLQWDHPHSSPSTPTNMFPVTLIRYS